MDPEDLRRLRRHLPQPDVASEERIASLNLRIDEAQREADEARITQRQRDLPSMLLLMSGPLAPMEIYSPVRRRPIATYALIAVNVVVFGLQAISPGSLFDLALVPNNFLQGIEPWTIVTAMFLHGNLLHLVGNMYFLAIWRCSSTLCRREHPGSPGGRISGASPWVWRLRRSTARSARTACWRPRERNGPAGEELPRRSLKG
jgi:hypothetical protein